MKDSITVVATTTFTAAGRCWLVTDGLSRSPRGQTLANCQCACEVLTGWNWNAICPYVGLRPKLVPRLRVEFGPNILAYGVGSSNKRTACAKWLHTGTSGLVGSSLGPGDPIIRC